MFSIPRCLFYRERQQQLDELSKELSKVQEECDLLRMKLRSMQKAGGKGASNVSVFISY